VKEKWCTFANKKRDFERKVGIIKGFRLLREATALSE
jgi:hypothetical protein